MPTSVFFKRSTAALILSQSALSTASSTARGLPVLCGSAAEGNALSRVQTRHAEQAVRLVGKKGILLHGNFRHSTLPRIYIVSLPAIIAQFFLNIHYKSGRCGPDDSAVARGRFLWYRKKNGENRREGRAMPKITRGTRRKIAAFLLVLLLGSALLQAQSGFLFTQSTTVVYAALAIYWGASVRRRILDVHTRRSLIAMVTMMLLLLLARANKYMLLEERPDIQVYSWYAYSVCFMGIALFSLLAALSIDVGQSPAPLRRARAVLLPLWGASSALALTNNLHQLVYRFDPGETNPFVAYSHGAVYWINTAAIAAMLAAAFVLVVHKGRRILSRRTAWIPAGVLVIFGLYYLSYYLNGNVVPDIIIPHLFNPPEALCFTLIIFWESCIQTGLLPSCSSYETILAISSTGAVITDRNGRVAVAARSAGDGQAKNTKDLLYHEHAIVGGTIRWTTDLSAVNALNERLDQSIEKLSEENELFEAELALREKRMRLETQNRLYDEVSHAVEPQARCIETFLNDAGTDTETDFRGKLARGCVLGAFIKRRANLEMLSDGRETLACEELFYCVRESLEYLRLCGVGVALSAQEAEPDAPEQKMPCARLIGLYESFERIIEAVPRGTELSVRIDREPVYLLRMELRGCDSAPAEAAEREPGVRVRRDADAVFIELGTEGTGEAA